ncbi:MAG: putative selenate reductase subunit YgfK [Lentimicrobium sp.]|nr:putative selenate reductase subunit YgfK [Lentimicrobium sp.]
MLHSTAFSTISIEKLFSLIDSEYQSRMEIFGIPEELFFKPAENPEMGMEIFGHSLHTPVGVAAGPHSQMAQNIIAAWLCGASYIELKTIQTLDELEVTKPCIDMQDEGYNCEWSQELRIHESFEEYLKAWIIIHLLQHKFGWTDAQHGGFVFNMSVGYNYEGILKDNVQWFLNSMADCGLAKAKMVTALKPYYQAISEINIPDCISDNITLSTMHGCPPDEIEKIGHYLLREKKLHTFVKLNPTLLGKDELRDILNHKLGFKTTVPDIAFEHDLKYNDAIGIITRLQETADQEGLVFGVKLTNTLESLNHRDIFPPAEQMMYMSGRALHPISINVARKLQHEFMGKLRISFSGGADCFNIADIVSCGLKPVTVCSDLLKPGGYGKLYQYIKNLSAAPLNRVADKLLKLNEYADAVLNNDAYKSDPYTTKNIKTGRGLGLFDCIHAPCVDECPTNQDIPEYMYYTSLGDYRKALDVVLAKNPFPHVLGSACDHICQAKCTRINYDHPLKIRDIKLFIAENGKETDISIAPDNGKKVAIIGAGPSGLSCAYFLRQARFAVEIFETKEAAGGMVYDAIPGFRMKMDLLDKDIERIKNLGVKVHFKAKIDRPAFGRLRRDFDFVYIGAGAQKFRALQMEGDDAQGILNPHDFLKDAKAGRVAHPGNNIVVIGGGNTAMDVARTAKRLTGEGAKVKVLYRRTRAEMPADREEIEELLAEGIDLLELLSPEKINVRDGRIVSLLCAKMRLEAAKPGSRPVPVKTGEALVDFPVDTLIPALGQEIDIDFALPEELRSEAESYETQLENVFIGGDALRGAATIVKAVGDGRKAAIQIAAKAGIVLPSEALQSDKNIQLRELMVRKSERVKMDPAIQGFQVHLSKEEAKSEAERCLLCNELCNVCVTVCPNRANIYYHAEAATIPVWQIDFRANDPQFSQKEPLTINQKTQVLNIADFCNECGNCTTFCPSSGKPFSDKPRFCLTERSFNQTDNSYLLKQSESETILLHRNGDQIRKLEKNKLHYLFSNQQIEVKFDLGDFSLLEGKRIMKVDGPFDLTVASEMKLLMDTLEKSETGFITEYLSQHV